MTRCEPAWHLEQVNIEAAWLRSTGCGVVIAVVDDAVDTRHPELEEHIYRSRGPTPATYESPAGAWAAHGTKCAGVIGAKGIGVVGVAPDAGLMVADVAELVQGIGSRAEAEAIRWAAAHGADVMCCAWGPNAFEGTRYELPDHTGGAIRWAVEHGRDGRGCVIIWSAGNDDADLALNGYAGNPNVIAVGACNDHGKRSSYSNWGDALWCVFPSNDPGDPHAVHREIATTTPTGSFALGETFYTDSFGFTSAACAGVAGVCALILSANRDLTWRQVKEVLRDSCVKIDHEGGTYDESGHSPLYGYGRPDAGAAVQLALERRPSTA